MINKNHFSKIKKLLKFAYNNRYSDFYRTKYRKAGFNPLTDFNSIKDVKKIPFLSKQELLNADISKLLFVNEKDVLYIKSTSGTTGKPLYLFFSKLDMFPKWLKKKDFGRGLTLVNAINVNMVSITSREYRSHWSLNGDIHNLPAAAKMAADFRIEMLTLPSTLAIILSDYINDYPILKKSLKYLNLFGELVSLKKKEFLQKLYPGITILLGYAAAETGTIASQCDYLAKKTGQIYCHLRADYQHIEVINPDTGEEVGEGEKGEIVVTNPNLFGTPIIRYKTGDLVNIERGGNCPCGFSGPLLQTWGRVNYDIVKAGGFELRREFPEKIVDNLRDYLKDSFEAHVYENFENNKPKIRIELNLSLKKGVQESISLNQRIGNELLENWQVSSKLNLKKAIETGLFEPVKIKFVDFPVSLKAKKILILHQA